MEAIGIHVTERVTQKEVSKPTFFIGTVATSTTCETDCSLAPKPGFPVLNWRLTDLVVNYWFTKPSLMGQ